MRERPDNEHEFISPLTLTCTCCLTKLPGDAEFCPNCLDTRLSTKVPVEDDAWGEVA